MNTTTISNMTIKELIDFLDTYPDIPAEDWEVICHKLVKYLRQLKDI